MAIALENKTNVNAPTGTYPFGSIRNQAGATPGTPVSEEVYQDMHQFFAKMADAAGVSLNDLPDNDLNGWQYYEALQYIVYKFLRNELDFSVDNINMNSSKILNLSNGSASTDAVNFGQVVKNTGNETVAGVKTFSSAPVMSAGITYGAYNEKILIVPIIDWNLDTTAVKSVDTGLSSVYWNKITGISAVIFPDSDAGVKVSYNVPFVNTTTNDIDLSISFIDFDTPGSPVVITRKTSSGFDSTGFDQTGGYIRGYVIIRYLV